MYIIFFMFLFIISVVLLLFLLSFMFSIKLMINRAKLSPFECGFENLEATRLPFSIQFYLIAILFLVFDIEIIYLYSMVVVVSELSVKIWFYTVVMILLVLFLGLEYEKNGGLLKWVF